MDAIGKPDIDALVANAVTEVKTLEYKQELPGRLDTDKKEFLADITSFANASDFSKSNPEAGLRRVMAFLAFLAVLLLPPLAF